MALASTEKSPKIVIIGAGISGIAAAHKLINAGITNVQILEAKRRVGGRIFTQKLDGKNVEIGAEFIHGCEGNPVYDLAEANRMVSGEEDSDEGDDETETNHFYMQKGKRIATDIVKEVFAVLNDIFQEGKKFSRDNVPIDDQDESLGAFAYRKFYKYLAGKQDSVERLQMREAIFHWRLLFENGDNACKSIYEMSLYAFGEYMDCKGDLYNRLPGGYQGVLDKLLVDIPASCIRLQCAVKAIYWDVSSCVPYIKGLRTTTGGNPTSPSTDLNASSPVQIHTTNGEVIEADHVIVTCSLGFLKRNAHTLFSPLLHNDKMAVIQRMGFGTVNKIFLKFKRPWWDKDCAAFCLSWLHDEPFTLQSIGKKHRQEYLRNDWFRGISQFDVVEGHTALLEGWIAGEEAEVMETIPDNVVMLVCHELLQKFTGNRRIPKPISILRSSWYKDEETCGSYSHIKVGHTAADCDVLARPLMRGQVPVLLFAGEATHREYYSTTHGALFSGQREADRILKFAAQKHCGVCLGPGHQCLRF